MTGLNVTATTLPTLGQNEADGEGKTQLHRAVIGNFVDDVKALLVSGAAVNIKDHAENEALHYAVLSNNVTIVKELLRFGSNPNTKGRLGRSAVHLATSSREILAALLLNGANPSMQDDNGDTPLHLILPLEANDSTLIPSVTALLSAGASLNLANNAEFLPFHRLAERNEYTTKILDLLTKFLDAGANIEANFPNGQSLFHRFLPFPKRCTSQNAPHFSILKWAIYFGNS